MGRGSGGGGGRGGSGGGGSRPRFQFFRGFSGLSRDTKDFLRHVAVAKGLRDVDELLTVLGKNGHEISREDARQMMIKECGHEYAHHVILMKLFAPGKGYRACNELVDQYIQAQKASEDWFIKLCRKRLLKYCGYTDDELRQLK